MAWLHTNYQGDIPARRRSPIPALTGLNVEQLRSCDERRYHSAKPPTTTIYLIYDILTSYASQTWRQFSRERKWPGRGVWLKPYPQVSVQVKTASKLATKFCTCTARHQQTGTGFVRCRSVFSNVSYQQHTTEVCYEVCQQRQQQRRRRDAGYRREL